MKPENKHSLPEEQRHRLYVFDTHACICHSLVTPTPLSRYCRAAFFDVAIAADIGDFYDAMDKIASECVSVLLLDSVRTDLLRVAVMIVLLYILVSLCLVP